MDYPNAKIYTDGSHYIAIPHEEHPERRRKRGTSTDDKKQAFETAYEKNKTKNKAERTENIVESIKEHFANENEAREYVERNAERKLRNLIAKRVRLWRKVNLQEWSYFATFTFDSQKHTEESFRKSLSNCLKHLSSRKSWKYVGVWERGGNTDRLHFHSLLYIPTGAEIGETIDVNDYSFDNHKRQITYQNTYFNERYGRTDFKPIHKYELGDTVAYLIKYIEKSGERIVYSKGLPQYFVSDILENDVICGYGIEDRKLLLGDCFDCFLDGEYIGEVCPEVIEKMKKSN
ncbi:MAG: hypothetical protein RR338_03655 [Clostridia bacterium]